MERWRQIQGCDGKYEVSDLGRVRNPKTGSVLKPRIHKKTGHPMVNLYVGGKKTTFIVARIVAEAFVEKKTVLKSVDHKNGDITDNRACNLRWAGIPVDELRAEYVDKRLTTYEIARIHGYKDHKPVLRQLKAAGIERRSWKDAVGDDGKARTSKAIESFRKEFPDAPEGIANDRCERHWYRIGHRRHDNGITLKAVGDRDGWVCGICGKKIKHAKGFGPESPTVDHIVPIIKGGTDTWDNVQIAHARCNSMKGDKTLEEARERARSMLGEVR